MKCVCALAVMAAFGAPGIFAEDSSSVPNAQAVASPPHDVVVAAQPNEPVPAPLEIPVVTNSIPPSATGEVPATSPEITAVPPRAPVPEAPTAAAEIIPPPPTPSDILGLSGKEHAKERARHEKCLANAVYFESRGELMRGQVAVAQVVLNRVFSPY